MCSKPRELKYSLAINEALHQLMETDSRVFLLGQGVKSPWYVGATAQGLLERFGEQRVIDTPVSENAMTGAAVGAAIVGMRPVVVHPRMDFMFYAFDPIINQAANWRYMSGGRVGAPVVFWGIINRGGEQAAQHSQALHSIFAHIPGLKVVAPSSAFDAKGLMVAAIRDDDPVVFIDDRWLYGEKSIVPEEIFEVEIGKGKIVREGADVSIICFSHMVPHVKKAAEVLQQEGLSVEIVDLRTVKPLDREMIVSSVEKTGRGLICDVGWTTGGVGAEVAAIIAERDFGFLKAPIRRLGLADIPAPASRILEEDYYPDFNTVIDTVREMFG